MARQAPLSMGFSRQEYWSRLSFPSSSHRAGPTICETYMQELNPVNIREKSSPASHRSYKTGTLLKCTFRKPCFQEKLFKQSLIAGYYQNLIHWGKESSPSASSSFPSGRQEMLKYSPSHPLPTNGGEKNHKQKQFWSAQTRDIALLKTITGLWNILSPNTYHITESLFKEVPVNQYIMSRKNYEKKINK